MPRLTVQQTNFTSGEFSPRLEGRTDIDQYSHAAKEMTNCHPVIHGGAVRRGGMRFAKAAKFSDRTARMVEFVFSKDLAYMLEVGDFYIRIFGPSGAYLTEIASPYSVTQAQEIDYSQGADTMFIWHSRVFPQRLRRFTDTIWDLSPTPFTVQPFDEQGYAPAAALTLSALSGTVTATASTSAFLPSDVGRNLASGAGIGLITGYTDTTHVTVAVSIAFQSLSVASGAWSLDASPQGFAIPSAKDPVGAAITIAGATTRAATLTLTALTGAITINASAGVFVPGDTGKVLYADSGIVTLTYVSATQCTGTTTADFLYRTYATGAWGIQGNVFRVGDVGSFISLNAGLAKITAFTSDASVTAKIVTALTSVVAVPPLAWSLESAVWSAVNGYPRSGTLHEQRLWAAGSPKFPQTVWGSRTGLYLDFTSGTADSDACIFPIASDEVNPISYLASGRSMLVHTYGGEFSMQGGTEKPITPSNVQIKPQSKHGSKTVRPVTVGKESIFVQRAGRKVRAMSYQFTIDGYNSPDLVALAEHITVSGIISMAYQQEPDPLLWLALGNGTLVSCTLDRDQAVTGWAKHITDGAVESIAVMPIGDSEQLWLLVRRSVNGSIVRYVEFVDTLFEPMLPIAADPTDFPPQPLPIVYGTTVDSGVQFDVPGGQTTFSVPHLIGKTVDIVADGSPMPQMVVDNSGSVTIPRPGRRTLIGLHFKSLVRMLTPETGTGDGTAQGNAMRTSEITLRFLNTLGAKVMDGDGDAQEMPFRSFGPGVLDQPPPVFSGEVRLEKLGWERGRSDLTIEQDQPLPMHLLSVIRKFTVNT